MACLVWSLVGVLIVQPSHTRSAMASVPLQMIPASYQYGIHEIEKAKVTTLGLQLITCRRLRWPSGWHQP